MSFTGNLSLDKLTQGQVRFDTALNAALDKIDAQFQGSDAGVLSLGHLTKTLSFRPLGVERATIDAAALRLGGGLKVGNFALTGEAGMVRWTGTDFEGYTGSGWVSLTSGGGGGGPSGAPSPEAVIIPAAFSSASGSRTVYTCPVGKIAFIASMHWDPSATSVNIHLVPSGGSPATGNRFANGTASVFQSMSSHRFLLTAGDFINVDSGGSSVRFKATILEHDAAGALAARWKKIQATLTASTDNILYTASTGKYAWLGDSVPGLLADCVKGSAGGIYVCNTTGGNINLDFKLHDGSSTHTIDTRTIVANTSQVCVQAGYIAALPPGWSIRANPGSSGLNAFSLAYEWGP